MTVDPVCGTKIPTLQHAYAVRIHKGRILYFHSPQCLETFEKNPDKVSSPFGRLFTVGVMGAASGDLEQGHRDMARQLGQEIAKRGFGLITGACPGFPYEAASGFKETGGVSIGISPALSEQEHIARYQSPNDLFDIIIFTGSGLMGREVINIRSSDIVLIVGGHSGTLGEFSIAYDEGKLIGVLEGSGGITEILPDIVKKIGKETGSRLLYHSDPSTLLNNLISEYTTNHFRRPSVHISG
jgi:uncharacterized protein (TIGR00725 family)